MHPKITTAIIQITLKSRSHVPMQCESHQPKARVRPRYFANISDLDPHQIHKRTSEHDKNRNQTTTMNKMKTQKGPEVLAKAVKAKERTLVIRQSIRERGTKPKHMQSKPTQEQPIKGPKGERSGSHPQQPCWTQPLLHLMYNNQPKKWCRSSCRQ